MSKHLTCQLCNREAWIVAPCFNSSYTKVVAYSNLCHHHGRLARRVRSQKLKQSAQS
jgi:hypothetical protein